MTELVGRNKHWRQTHHNGQSLWPRTFHDDAGVTHAVVLSFDAGMIGPVLMCSGARAHRTGVDDRIKPLSCLWCIVRDPWFTYIEEDDDDEHG